MDAVQFDVLEKVEEAAQSWKLGEAYNKYWNRGVKMLQIDHNSEENKTNGHKKTRMKFTKI